MKRKIKHMKNEINTEQTVARLIQMIDDELARGEEADEQLILECTAYLQELSPETAIPAEVTERYLQAELTDTQTPPHVVRHTIPRKAVKLALRLAAVISALAMFCVAVPAMAIYISNESNFEEEQQNVLIPVLELLSHSPHHEPIDYTEAPNFTKEPGYSATYSDTAEMIKTELPPDILCPNDLPEDLAKYQVQVSYDGYKKTTGSFINVWEIRWKEESGSWLFSAAYRKNFKPINHAYYELLYDSYESSGRTYYYWIQKDGQYRAFCMHDRVIYNILAADYETMIYLINHAAHASKIIPSADVEETVSLLTPDQYDHPDRYTASYVTTADFIDYENVNILAVDDAAEALGDFSIRVRHQIPDETFHTEWTVRWEDSTDRWNFVAHYQTENQEFRRAEYDSTPDYFEKYTVNGRTYYICEISAQEQEQLRNSFQYLVNYFEGNIIYSINAADRETMELLLNSLAMAEELAAK